MFKWLLSSGVVMVSLLLVQSGAAAFQFSDVSEIIQKGPKRGLETLQTLGDGGGEGFYEAIYADTIRNPNRIVEEQIKDRFGIDFKVDLSLPAQQGQFLFTDFFKNPGGALQNPSAPVLRSSLQSDCIRIKMSQAQDEERRWNLLKRRLDQRAQSEGASQEQVQHEIILRLVGIIDDETERQVQQAFAQIPEYQSLSSQQQLLRCYEELSSEVDFELKLQSLLHPSRKQMEVMQTFMNGRLDDFQQMVPVTDISYGTAFPRYDLLFDIDVIDMIFFGTAVATDTARVAAGGAVGSNVNSFDDYEEIVALTPNPNLITNLPLPAASNTVSTPSSTLTSTSPHTFESSGSQFGTSSQDFAGPMCVETATGLDLDYSQMSREGDRVLTSSSGETRSISSGGAIQSIGTLPTPPVRTDQIVQEAFEPNQRALTQEGAYDFGANRKALCEGTVGVNIGNDFLQLLFCLDIRFAKLGKTWQTGREDNCIACHIAAMNQTFEERVLKSSVRPHKNTGTVMESAICEDGYGDDVGFHFFLEWVPVKFYPDICYPKGGVTDPT